MMRPIPALLTAAIALTLAGCAEMQWARSGADTATVSRDLDACRAVALRSGAPPAVPAGSLEAASDSGRPRAIQPAAGSNERFVAEQEAVRRCMVERGYTLQPRP